MISVPINLVSQTDIGYYVENDTTYFIFDEEAYDVTDVYKVTVTGTFRGWDQDMDDSDWNLTKVGKSMWQLKIHNPKYTIIPPSAEFKFRINEGEWMSPPSHAENAKGGNLVYLHHIVMPKLKAELRSNGTIWFHTEGFTRSVDPHDYKLKDASGNEIPIAEILPNTAADALLKPAVPIDIKRVYFLEIPGLNLQSHCSFDGWFREIYSNKDLGANIENNQTVFRLFAPRADLVKLYLYHQHDDKNAYEVIEMVADADMVWEAFVDKNLKGVFYDFTIHGPDDPGNHFYHSLSKHISDPYARVNMEAWGKSMVWEKTIPATPLKDGIPAMEDVIAYEVHVQDFTEMLPVSQNEKGTFPAMHKSGLRNSRGEKIGFDYLVDLGINTLHLMPVQEYMHHPDDIWKASFKDDPYMIAQGIAEENYQWGYRTSHAMAVENKYRKLGSSPGEERNQFRDLVQAYHDKGIAVIIDIVPNHTAEDMDGHWFFHWNVIDKQYYYRTKELEHIGEYGNEVKTENRPMVQKWLIDQCLQFINEFGVDGFRIDLAGQIDKQTLIKIKDAIGHDKILYGEPWIASNDPDYENNPDWDWYKHDSPITFFQDDTRNAFKGPVFDLVSLEKDRGYPGGNLAEKERVKMGLSNTQPDDKTTSSGINYLDIHDNWALPDQFAVRDWDGRKAVEQDMIKIAATLLYTSLGPLVTHGGTEMLRSKAHAPLEEISKTLNNGVTMYWHGKRDTYNLKTANLFLWENVGKLPDAENSNDYKNMLEFWKGLNAFRNSDVGKVFRISGPTPAGYYHFFDTRDEVLGYTIHNQVMVFINVGRMGYRVKHISPPDGKWKLIGTNQKIDHIKGLPGYKALNISENQTINIDLPPQAVRIWIRDI